MANWLVRLFIDPEKLSEANRKYRERIAEINEENADVKAAIKDKRAENKAQFLAAIDRNTAKRNTQLATRKY